MGGRPGVIGVFVIVCAGFAAAAAADSADSSPSFGVTGDSQYVVTAWDVSPDVSGTTWDFTLNNGYRFATGGSKEFIGAAHLPQGALVQQIGLEACDSSADGQVGALLIRFDPLGHTILAGVGTGATETPGCAEVFASLAVPETIDQVSHRYLVVVSNDTTDGSNTFGAVHVVYKLQVSPPPGTPTFNDVPITDPAFQFIEAFAASGITAGCGGGNYCPDAALTRRQMAVFLAKALGLNWPEVTNPGGANR